MGFYHSARAKQGCAVRFLIVLFLFIVSTACQPVADIVPAAIADGPVNWSYIVVADDGPRWRARGFDHAVPPLSELRIYRQDSAQDQQQDSAQEHLLGQVLADNKGRFDLSFDLVSADLQSTKVKVQVLDSQGLVAELNFKPRQLALALPQAVQGRFVQTGALPNDLRFVPARCNADHAPLLMLSSGDNLLDNIDVQTGQRAFAATRFSSQQALAAQPFNVAVHGPLAAVSLFGQDRVSLVELSSATMLDSISSPEKLQLPEVFIPATAVDSDADGQLESQIRYLRPRHFEAVAFDGQRLYVSAVNMLRSEPPAVYAPGMVLVYDWDGEKLHVAQPKVLWPGFANPQTIILKDDRVYVVSTGIIEQDTAAWQASTAAGLSIFSRSDLQLIDRIDLGRAAAGPAIVSDDGHWMYIGSLLHADLFKIDLAQRRIVRGMNNPIRLVDAEGPQSIFGLQWHASGLIFVSSFDQDALFVVDSDDDQVSPWPFVVPLDLNPDNAVLAGSHQIALRPGRNGVDFRGPDFFVLQSLAARVVTVDSRYIFGP